MTKTHFAFKHTCQMMFERGKVYFWTFTFRNVHPDWDYSLLWNRFQKRLCDWYWGNIGGVRVTEAHSEHGLHFHVLLNRRVPIRAVRRIAEREGIFWIDVRVADEGAIDYLIPYVSKSFREKDNLHRGVRRWSAFGNVQKVRKNDVELDSVGTRMIKQVRLALNKGKLSYPEMLAVSRMSQTGLDMEAILDRLATSARN